ncbi:MAG: transcriptional activator NhaR [Myxococcota bacterium]|nr:transcriptional activator NhaR [Myxococcota bacterium]
MAIGWLNYHHLLYFWTVARTGSLARAAAELHLAQPTISAQIKQLEETLGYALFERQGRRLALTGVGRTVMRYADEIFRLGNELKSVVAGAPAGRQLRLEVGVADVVPKVVAEALIRPALDATLPLRLVCREGPVKQLLASLALHEVDVVIADAPAGEQLSVRVFNHLLGKSGTSFFAAPALAGLEEKFPQSLHGAPLLVPSDASAIRARLEHWFARQSVHPVVTGEFDDSALLTAFGQRGLGVFAMPSVIEAEVCRQFHVTVIGRTEEIVSSFYAVSAERKLRHPSVVALAETARHELFREPAG